MELKTRNQYTYFIHTFLINKNRYHRYIMKLLKDGRFKLKIFQKEQDIDLYTYFLPRMRNFLFKTFELNQTRIEKMDELPFETKSALLAEYPCITFEYDLKKDLQGKMIDENSIFFKIQKVGIIIFNTGIGFLYFKTSIEDSDRFSEVLNFNNQFRNINNEYHDLKSYESIRIQGNYFDDITEIKEFITDITGPNFDAMKLNLDVERFYTYSYTCIDQADWNSDSSFDNIKSEFLKYINICPYFNRLNINENDKLKIISNNAFSKIGISKLGVNLLSSDIDEINYTLLPREYENQYFYTYILALYQKVYLKKIDYDFRAEKNLKKTRQEFVEFTKKIWVQEITSEDLGSLLYQDMRAALEIEDSYLSVKSKYDILYRELKIEKTEKMSIFIAVVLVVTLIFNILNWLKLF